MIFLLIFDVLYIIRTNKFVNNFYILIINNIYYDFVTSINESAICYTLLSFIPDIDIHPISSI